ncbi:MAG: carbohydrate binding family 9 domain-containing protein [bacterium]|nr:carbohydrate binding family 9 domain-containing protein [bacterium]
MLIFMLILSSALRVPLITEDVKLDGFLEPLWDSALVFSNFKVFEPQDKELPSFATKFYVLQTENSIYVAFRCEQDQVVSRVGLRDVAEGDFVGVYFDTFGRGGSVYFFGVNVAGVQVDRIITGGGKLPDDSWDGVWFSAVRNYNGEYIVEIKIPFKTLQYDLKNPIFRMEATRFITETNERLYLGKYGREWGLNPVDFPIEIELKLPNKSFGFELLPVILVEKDSMEFRLRAGVGSKWSPSNSCH